MVIKVMLSVNATKDSPSKLSFGLEGEVFTPKGIFWERYESDGKDVCRQVFESLLIHNDSLYRIRAEGYLLDDSIELVKLSSPVISRRIKDYSSLWIRYEAHHHYKTVFLRRYDSHRCNINGRNNVMTWITGQGKGGGK